MGLFKLEVVKNCPVGNGSKGVMIMSPDLIATIAGAVRDDIEWIAYLNGTRSADGFEVKVDRFTIPQQYRSRGEAEIAGSKEGVELADDVVGVIHSHHTMGAFWSGTDTNELNPRFPSSIVVAIANNCFGFNYKAEGKVLLPCGAVGKVDFDLSVEGVERFTSIPVRASHEGLATGLGDCPHITNDTTTDPYEVVPRAKCGMFTDPVPKPLAFGVAGGSDFITVVEQCTQSKASTYTTGSYGNYGSYNRGLPPGKYSGGVDGKTQSGLGYLGNDSRTNTHTAGFRSDHLTKRERKRLKRAEKWAAKRGGLVRIDDAETSSDFGDKGRYMYDVMCDSCRNIPKLVKWNEEFQQWLCVGCNDDATRIVSECLAEMNAEQGAQSTIDLDDWVGWGS